MKDAKAPSIQVQSAGQPQAYQHGEHRVNLPQYTNDHFEDLFIHPETINNHQNAFNFDYNDNDNNIMDQQLNDGDLTFADDEPNERLCYLRLSKLISLLQLNS